MGQRGALKPRGGGGAPAPAARLPAIDAWRGIAIVAMIAYHFAFDLRLYGLARYDFERSAFWLSARALIVSTFLLLVGVSLVLAWRARVAPGRRLRRLAAIGACAIGVSLASHAMFPERWIGFGILHAIAVTSLAAWPVVARPRLALAIGAVVIAAGLSLSHPAFDTRALDWIGFATRKPATEDYVPLFPWAGAVFAGIALGHALIARAQRLPSAGGRAARALRWLGRHGLAVYMVHQPLMIGALALVLRRLP